MIRLEVFTFDMHRLGVINKYSSISYEEKFADVGTFELTCPVDYDTIELSGGFLCQKSAKIAP